MADEAAHLGIGYEEVTRITLLRHGEVEQLGERRVRGQFDAELSAHGVGQHARLAAWLRASGQVPDAVLTSDLTRCSELAERLRIATSAPLAIDERLREQHMGDWQGRTWREIQAEDSARATAYWDDYVETAPPGGESLRDLSERVGGWWDELVRERAGQRLWIVTHVGVIRAVLCRALGVPTSDALRFAPAVASSTELLTSESGAVLTSFGERPWLGGGGA